MLRIPYAGQSRWLSGHLLSVPILFIVVASLLPGCSRSDSAASAEVVAKDNHAEGDAHDQDEESSETEDGILPGNIPIPPQVRQNLGITFAKVEMRRVASTMRLPGRFEIRPSAVREYHAPLAGRIELLVNQYDHVTTGTPLYRLDSGEWRRMQQELVSLQAEVLATSAGLMTAKVAREGGQASSEVITMRVESSDAHIKTLTESIAIAEEREKQITRLQQLVGGKLTELNEARSQLANLRNELSQAREDRAELEHEHLQLSTAGTDSAYGTTETRQASLLARQAEYESAKARRALAQAGLRSIMGEAGTTSSISAENLEIVPTVTIYAASEGTVSQIPVTSGAYVDGATQVLVTVNPKAMRFRAVALQSDIASLQQEMTGNILPPGGATSSEQKTLPVSVSLALEADHEERTLDLVANVDAADVPWARSGVSTDLELVIDDSGYEETAIPAAAIIQDGLEKVFFRRRPENPDAAMRVVADMGISDGKWVELYSGVAAGDEVVLHGVYELKLATADSPAKGGHYHADGTFHDEDH